MIVSHAGRAGWHPTSANLTSAGSASFVAVLVKSGEPNPCPALKPLGRRFDDAAGDEAVSIAVFAGVLIVWLLTKSLTPFRAKRIIDFMSVAGVECDLIISVDGVRKVLVIGHYGEDRPRWHCRLEQLSSNGTGFVRPAGNSYKLYDSNHLYVGMVYDFSLNRIEPAMLYQISAGGKLLQAKVSYVEANRKTVFSNAPRRELVLPPGWTEGYAGGSIAGIGDPDGVKGTRVR